MKPPIRFPVNDTAVLRRGMVIAQERAGRPLRWFRIVGIRRKALEISVRPVTARERKKRSLLIEASEARHALRAR